jgi:hypothetical protein
MFTSSIERRHATEIPYSNSSGPSRRLTDLSPRSRSVADVDVRSLPPGTKFLVETSNSRYHFEMLEDGWTALVQGGRHFPHVTVAAIEGSTFGGRLLKSGWIALGLFLEMSAGGKEVVTSRVRSITIDSSAGSTWTDAHDDLP